MNKFTQYFNKQRIILIVVVTLLYGNTLKNGYSIDDVNVTESSNITASGVKSIPKIIRSYYIERAKGVMFEYRPLVKISFAIEHELFGVSASISHLFNLLFYLIGLFLLFSVLKLLLPNYSEDTLFYCVFLFAILPIHTEVVASIKNRDMLLCFAFCMASFKSFILFSKSKFKWWKHFFLGIVYFYVAFLSKLDALPFFAIFPILIFAGERLNKKVFIYIISALFFSFVLFSLTKRISLDKAHINRLTFYFENPLFFNNDLKYRVIAMFNSLGFYVAQVLYPVKQCCYYGAGTLSVTQLSTYGYLGIFAAPVLVYSLIKSYIKKNLLLFSGLFIFCACVSMYLNFFKPVVGIVADRFAYFASIGSSIVIVALVKEFIIKNKNPSINLKLIIVGMAILFGFIIIIRNNDWKNIETLTHADYKKYPENAFLNYKEALFSVSTIKKNNAAGLNNEQQKKAFLNAKQLLEKSLSVDPDYIVSRSFLCYVLVYLLNDFKGALPQIDKGLALEETAELYFYKGICMRETHQGDSAEIYLKKSIATDVGYYNPYNLIMFDYNAKKEYAKTIFLFKNALTKRINTTEINNGLGKTYWEMGNNIEAKKYYQKALDIDANNREAAAMVKHLSK